VKPPEKKILLTIDEEIRLLERGGGYFHNFSTHRPEPNDAGTLDRQEPGVVVVSTPGDSFLAQAGTTPGHGNPYGPTGRISPRTGAGNDANPFPGEPMPPETDTTHQQKSPIRTAEKRSWE